MLYLNPFRLDVAVENTPLISINSRNLFSFEHTRQKQLVFNVITLLSYASLFLCHNYLSNLWFISIIKKRGINPMVYVYDCYNCSWSSKPVLKQNFFTLLWASHIYSPSLLLHTIICLTLNLPVTSHHVPRKYFLPDFSIHPETFASEWRENLEKMFSCYW